MPTPDHARALLSLDAKVVIFGLLNATLMTVGMCLQKLNGMRGGHPLWSGWLLLSLVCFAPTFPIANKVFLAGGRMSLFIPMGALSYVLAMLAGRFYFGEIVSMTKWAGCALILAGVTVTARG